MFRNEDTAIDLLNFAIKEIENITRSPLSQKLIFEPVLTPSLHLIDRVEVFDILDKQPGHKFLKKVSPQKDRIFFPIKVLINLRKKLKIETEQIIKSLE